MDLTTISALLGSLKTATDIAKFVRESDVSLEKAETRLKLADLVSAIADAKIQAAEVRQALLDKEEEIRQLRAQLDVAEKMQWEKPYYWLVEGSSKDGPFCQRCYDEHCKPIRLQGDGGWWECKSCGSNYTDSTYTGAISSLSVGSSGRFSDF